MCVVVTDVDFADESSGDEDGIVADSEILPSDPSEGTLSHHWPSARQSYAGSALYNTLNEPRPSVTLTTSLEQHRSILWYNVIEKPTQKSFLFCHRLLCGSTHIGVLVLIRYRTEAYSFQDTAYAY